MKKKKIMAIMLSLAMAATLAACGGSSSSSTSDSSSESASSDAASSDSGETSYDTPEYTIKLGHSDTTTNLLNISLENYSAYVLEQTNGRVKIDIYAAEQLGSNSEMAEMVEMGSLDAMAIPQGNESNYAPKLNVLGLPFLFSSYDQVYGVLDGEIGDELVADLADHNMIQLAYWENGLRQITNSVRPIETPADLQGMKIRTPEDSMTLAIFTALGASPSPLAWSETYLALQQKTFDGQENPIANIYANNLADVQTYLSMTNHKYESKNIIFSLTTWNKLPEDVQEVLLEGAKIYGSEHRQAIVDNQDSMLEELEEAGMQVSYPDTATFQEATASVYEDFYAENSWAEDLVTRIQAEIGSAQ